MQICFQFTKKNDVNSGASIVINAPSVTGAEQDIVILDADGKAIAVIQMQPGYDRQEVESQK